MSHSLRLFIEHCMQIEQGSEILELSQSEGVAVALLLFSSVTCLRGITWSGLWLTASERESMPHHNLKWNQEMLLLIHLMAALQTRHFLLVLSVPVIANYLICAWGGFSKKGKAFLFVVLNFFQLCTHVLVQVVHMYLHVYALIIHNYAHYIHAYINTYKHAYMYIHKY